MNKRYQVFVSSTYADLKEERQKIIQILMEMDCIPAVMEFFPSIDEEQFNFIKKIIDYCDYYLLIIGGRYGTAAAEGISYTEKEFDYAVSKGLKVVALIHEDPNSIPLDKSEKDPEMREKLERFKQKVESGRLVKYWKNLHELPGLVSLNLQRTITTYPGVGWVRGDQVPENNILTELNELRKENQTLQKQLYRFNQPQNYNFENLADIDSKFTIHGVGKYNGWKCLISWKEIFSLIAPYLIELPNEEYVKTVLTSSLQKQQQLKETFSLVIDDQDFKTITIQLMAYDLIKTTYAQSIKGNMAVFWSLTPKGERLMMDCRTVRVKKTAGLAAEQTT